MSFKAAVVLIFISLLMIPTTINALNNWDKSETGYKSGCDPVYRIYMGIETEVTSDACEELKSQEVLYLRLFFLSLSVFLTSSLIGLALLFGQSDEPPHGLI